MSCVQAESEERPANSAHNTSPTGNANPNAFTKPSISESPAPSANTPSKPSNTFTTITTNTSDEMECKICYQRYNRHNRKPKILDCLHRVCARCLNRILDVGESSGCVCCPFCRHETRVNEVAALPDDSNVMTFLAFGEKCWSSDHNKEVVLTPKSLSSSDGPYHDSSNCLVVTIMEVQREAQHLPSRNGSSDDYGEHSLDSVSVASNNGTMDQDAFAKICNHAPRILVWLLGFLYFGSLPLGIYLLVIQKVTLGIVCVSLVPTSLTVCLVYGFCQCLCQGVCDCPSRS